MAKLTKHQQEFWDVLSHKYPSKHNCNNCTYNILHRMDKIALRARARLSAEDMAASRAAGAPVQTRCLQPEYVKTRKPGCYKNGSHTRWRWDGKTN